MRRVSAHLCQAWGCISIHTIYTQPHSHTHAVIQHALHGSPLLNCAGRGVNGHSAASRAAERDAPGSEGEAPALSFNYSGLSESHTFHSPHQECIKVNSRPQQRAPAANPSERDCSEWHAESRGSSTTGIPHNQTTGASAGLSSSVGGGSSSDVDATDR